MKALFSIRTPFGLSHQVSAADADLSDEEQWGRQRVKYLAEHGHDRERCLSVGAVLGPIAYSEKLAGPWDEWVGEWRTEVLSLPEGSL